MLLQGVRRPYDKVLTPGKRFGGAPCKAHPPKVGLDDLLETVHLNHARHTLGQVHLRRVRWLEHERKLARVPRVVRYLHVVWRGERESFVRRVSAVRKVRGAFFFPGGVAVAKGLAESAMDAYSCLVRALLSRGE